MCRVDERLGTDADGIPIEDLGGNLLVLLGLDGQLVIFLGGTACFFWYFAIVLSYSYRWSVWDLVFLLLLILRRAATSKGE
jgi:hypothetical protein